MVSLFQKGHFNIRTGRESGWVIDCGTFDDEDWECVAQLIAERHPNFERVFGVSHFGRKLAEYLTQYETHGSVLLVDDVLFLPSMNKERLYWRTRKNYCFHDIQGFVIFSTLPCPSWVRTLWQLDVRTDEWNPI